MAMKEMAMGEETTPDEGRSPSSDKGDNSSPRRDDGGSSEDVSRTEGESVSYTHLRAHETG